MEAAGLYYNSHLANAKKNKLGLAFKGHAQVRGKDTVQIEVTTPAGLKRQVFFDSQTHLIAEESAQIAGIDQQIFYDDYRPVEGLKLPHKIELHRGSNVYDITITRAAVNAQVGERVFDFPRKSQVQLPDLKALFKEIDDNQKAIDKLKENYAGTRNEEETEYDKSGNVTKRESKEFTFFYLDGQRSLDAHQERRQAAQRRRTEEGKREDPKGNPGHPEEPGEERKQKRKKPKKRARKTMTTMSASNSSCAPASL